MDIWLLVMEIAAIHGRNALAILLTQDAAVVPLVLLVTIMGHGGDLHNAGLHIVRTLVSAGALWPAKSHEGFWVTRLTTAAPSTLNSPAQVDLSAGRLSSMTDLDAGENVLLYSWIPIRPLPPGARPPRA